KIIKNHKRNLLSHIFGKNIICVMFLSRYFTILYRIGILSNGFGSRRTAAQKIFLPDTKGLFILPNLPVLHPDWVRCFFPL
ncbi:TPA: hypothetical protein ACLBG2_001340, partial [Neisseria meningitidis]